MKLTSIMIPFTIAILLVLAVPVYLHAGTFSVTLGMNHSWLAYPDPALSFLENEFRPGYSVGAYSIHRLSRDMELAAGLRVFTVGRIDRVTFGRFHYETRINHFYLSIPIRLGYQVIEHLYPFVTLEPGIQLHSGSSTTGPAGENEDKTFTGEMNPFNVFAGTGLLFRFGIANQQFGVSGQFDWGLLRVSKDQMSSDLNGGWVDWRTREVVVHLEYFLEL